MSRFQPRPPEDQPQSPRYRMVRMPIAPPHLTYALLAVIVLVFLYSFSLSRFEQNLFFARWGKINEFIQEGEYYRLLTSMFLHLDLTHIVFNGMALYIVGQRVEGLFGHIRFALIYFLGGVSGSLASFVFTAAPSVGASGAIFALLGAEIVYFYQHRHIHGEFGRQYLNRLLILMVIYIMWGFLPAGEGGFRVDNAGHIGGLVGGVVLAWFIGPNYQVKADPTAASGLVVVDDNPIQRWAIPSVLYVVGLVAVLLYAVSG